jgi:hypothetical protein
MFGDNMVLQRGKPIRFWEWAKPGEMISVKLDGRTPSGRRLRYRLIANGG